ncbi:D-alanyl-D-alanine carboxypeptidase/D-alanyl-D-alanine endopeptidase [Nocardioides bizhenqiangii]|uniref:D-alanyl-D-alanine carboxypeptidase/D-alanyl-D-alanine-endopeptidase n=1 Tax=Nocardioides bizhenqiangii TaxID=3095076 RepID=A0ABZ0ZSY3_9ACTN|nr:MULTISPECIES: D-alanyl-D-alanine carboxypeptidase/D-alanyl-D-alanine-endopeptidase [unclassified Nocardioides]MDZ5622641.1 D-alanyl-D-alanine carboxypeptidase/D-alanyl-D-alanine-endopeptidase [Nocardioides sp. HM23]WQQ26909.1 D-alanyl-D-alanine carboxypeptidase/D-alanyl-D-alanine-endopeptidase [Nocardioides sp. HM61]
MTQRDPDHVRGALVGWVSAALALLLVAGVAGWQLGWFEDLLGDDTAQPADPAQVAPPPEVDVPPVRRPRAVATTADGGVRLDAAEVEAAVTGYLTDRDLGRDVLAAVAPLEGNSDGFSFASSASVLGIPASTTKVVTSAVALFLLGPDHVFETTTVLERGGGTPRLVLVGGGDPFLLSSPQAQWGTSTAATYAPPKADVVTLARQTAKALRADGVRRVRLGYDDSLFSGPTENPHWRADYIPDDVVSPITSLWVDEGRDPIGYGRVSDPSLTAAAVFADALAAAGIEVVDAPVATVADRAADEVASVSSAPLAQIVQRVLEVSDNEASEVLLRHIGIADQGDGSFAGGQTAVERVLRANGIDLRGSVLYDGSGLSRENQMSPHLLVDVIRWAASDQQPDLRAVVTSLPVAGFTGSLADRFDQGPTDGPGRVRAKTGTLTNVTSLAGIAVDLDGSLLVFAMIADRVRPSRSGLAEVAMDNAASSLGACHCAR